MRRISIYAGFLALALALPMAAAADEAPGVFKIPGTDSTIKFYGYAQLDTTVDFSGRPVGYENSDWATILPAVPNDDSPEGKRLKPQTYLTARTSRFGIQTSTPTKLGAVGVKVEGDFNGPSGFQSETYTNSVLFRLRHAYGTVGGLLVGQTWTTFIDLSAAPDTVDFNGPGTLALVRNPMIRYTFDLKNGMNLAVAAENTRGPQYGTDDRFQTIPDIHANFGVAGKGYTLSVRGVMQTYNRAAVTRDADGNPDTYVDESAEHKQSFSGAISGSYKLGKDTIVAQFAGGPGIGRYFFNAAGNPFVTEETPNGKLQLWGAYGAHVGYTHVWNPEFRSNLVGAYTWTKEPSGVDPTNNRQKDFVQAFVNTFWTFAKNAEFGLEYEFGQWKSFENGSPELKGTQNRVTGTFHYNFF